MMRTALLFITLTVLAFSATQCFNPKLPDVAFRCGDGGLCPDDYSCGDDGCCHKDGSDPTEHGACLIPADAAVEADATTDAST